MPHSTHLETLYVPSDVRFRLEQVPVAELGQRLRLDKNDQRTLRNRNDGVGGRGGGGGEEKLVKGCLMDGGRQAGRNLRGGAGMTPLMTRKKPTQ